MRDLTHRLVSAQEAFSQNRFDEVVRLLEPLRGEGKGLPEAWSLLGGAYLGLGQLAKAEKAARRAVQLRPASPDALCNLGVVLRKSGKYRAAAIAVRKAVRASPSNERARSELEELRALGHATTPISIEELMAARERAYAEWTGPRVVFGVGMSTDVACGAVSDTGRHPPMRAAGMVGGYGIQPPVDAAVVEFAGPGDGRTCPLCRFLLGSRFRVGSDEFFRYQPPIHINCRHMYVYFKQGAPGAVADFSVPSEDLVSEYGHFVTDPQAYARLRVPASATGRRFEISLSQPEAGGDSRIQVDWIHPDDLAPTSVTEIELCAQELADCRDQRVLRHLRHG